MSGASSGSVLLLGESGVGKTHYGAQLLNRLMKGDGCLSMDGHATNLEPFQAALERLNEGKAADHTPTSTYVDSVWPVASTDGRRGDLVWPDYGGEQISSIVSSRRVPSGWQTRVREAPSWLLLIRLQHTRIDEDIFSRPLGGLGGTSAEDREAQVSDQAKLVELLQILLYASGRAVERKPLPGPRLGVLLSCWDELGFDGTPADALAERLPMLFDFIRSNWLAPSIMGLSALGHPLSPHERDKAYVSRGPEHFGYIVLEDGSRSPDLTQPILPLLRSREGQEPAP